MGEPVVRRGHMGMMSAGLAGGVAAAGSHPSGQLRSAVGSAAEGCGGGGLGDRPGSALAGSL